MLPGQSKPNLVALYLFWQRRTRLDADGEILGSLSIGARIMPELDKAGIDYAGSDIQLAFYLHSYGQ